MRKTALTILLLCLSVWCGQAQGFVSESAREAFSRGNLWKDAANASGLAVAPQVRYGDFSLTGGIVDGRFRPAREAVGSTEVSAHTEGATALGRMQLWGDFSFRNIFDRGRNFDVSMYGVPDDMPYFLLDANESRWIRQEYEMGAKAALPLGDRWAAGLSVHYADKVGAKQKDPRSEDYGMDIEVVPGILWKLGDAHVLGWDARFCYDYERSYPSNANASLNQDVYTVLGLGEGSLQKVGGNDGMKEYYYTTWRYGGAVQYGYTGSWRLLAEAAFHLQNVEVMHQQSLPKNMGHTDQTALEGSVQVLWGMANSNKLVARARYKTTDGIEKVQQRDNTAFNQKWVTIAENKMSRYDRTEVAASYDHLFGAGKPDGYDAKVGGRASFTMEDDAYFIPASSFRWSRLFAGAFAARQFRIKAVRLLAEASAGYGLSLEGAYTYGGTKVDSPAVEMYRLDSIYYGTDFAQVGAAATCTLPSRGRVRYNLGLDADCRFAVGADEAAHRTVCALRFGVSF